MRKSRTCGHTYSQIRTHTCNEHTTCLTAESIAVTRRRSFSRSTCMCVRACVRAYVRACVRSFVRACMWMCKHVQWCVCAGGRACGWSARTCACVSVCVHAGRAICVCAFMCEWDATSACAEDAGVQAICRPPSVSASVCVCMHVCVHGCMCMHMDACAWSNASTSARANVCVVCAVVRMRACMRAHVCACCADVYAAVQECVCFTALQSLPFAHGNVLRTCQFIPASAMAQSGGAVVVRRCGGVRACMCACGGACGGAAVVSVVVHSVMGVWGVLGV